MLHMFLPNKARLVNYVLHSKHSRVENRLDNIIMSGGATIYETEEVSGDLGSPGRKLAANLTRTASVPDFGEIMKQAEKLFFKSIKQ